jgi:hypothetical protein
MYRDISPPSRTFLNPSLIVEPNIIPQRKRGVVQSTGMVEGVRGSGARGSSMRWVIYHFNPQVNRMQTDRVAAG